MNSTILETRDLTKTYRQSNALDHINLNLEKGKIYGFIGQNGAGKTTLLRLITGLAFPSGGTLSLWGRSTTAQLQEQRKRIGCMIETPALFPCMTAAQNLELQRIQRGIPDQSVIARSLQMAGLPDTGNKSVRNFSLGMRQRLGIAAALLNMPEFLILDEPINGLDPAGIVEIRNLLRSLNKEYGMTLEHVFPDAEVSAFHLALGALDGVGKHLVFDGDVFLHIEPVHNGLHPVAAEQAHQVVLHGQVEPGGARVSLTAGTASQLVVDPAGLVALGAHDEQAARLPDLLRLGLDSVLIFFVQLLEGPSGV